MAPNRGAVHVLIVKQPRRIMPTAPCAQPRSAWAHAHAPHRGDTRIRPQIHLPAPSSRPPGLSRRRPTSFHHFRCVPSLWIASAGLRAHPRCRRPGLQKSGQGPADGPLRPSTAPEFWKLAGSLLTRARRRKQKPPARPRRVHTGGRPCPLNVHGSIAAVRRKRHRNQNAKASSY